MIDVNYFFRFYQAGGMLHQIQHSNGVTYTMAINPADGLERPYQISTTAGWDTGNYPIRPPDGSVHDVTMTYSGDHEVRRTVKITTSSTGESSSTTTERYDRQGRLYEVEEPSGAGKPTSRRPTTTMRRIVW